ncbi:MAG: translation elongation factor Ts [Planctomycetes bacterium]|nr:translation elongation factor Ts [Planctomycetota bacterium]
MSGRPPAEISAESVRTLRETTGAGLMDCKKALLEAAGDADRAVDLLRRWGRASADRKSGRATKEGRIGCYIHHDGKKGVLVEVACETDFVAKSERFGKFLKDVSLHIAAARPQYTNRDEVPPDLLAKERDIQREAVAGKPSDVAERILDGRMKKFFAETVLLDQPFVKDETKTIGEILAETIAALGENVVVRRFAHFEIGR